MHRTLLPSPAVFDAATTAVLEAQYSAAERIVNGVRMTVLGLLGVSAVAWVPHLTRELNAVNLAVFAPMLLWALLQRRFHRPGRSWRHLSLVNTYVDITAVSALLLGYGLRGGPALAVKSPIWTAYFVILAARPFTGSPRRAALASATAALQYAAIAVFFISSHGPPFLAGPLDSVHSTGATLLDEAAKVMLLALGGMVVTYAGAWNERTLRRSIASMQASEERFRAVFEHSAVGIALLDHSSAILQGNGAFERLLGIGVTELVGRRLRDFVTADHRDTITAMLRDVGSGALASAVGEMRFVRRDGRIGWGALTVSRAEGEGELHFIAMVQDVTERKSLEAQLLHQVFHDPLTELANRALFRDRVAHALTRTSREIERMAVLFLDLDNFKTVNDTQGHAAGDRLLQVVASRLLNATRGCDTVARIGGDEFAVVIEHVNAGEGAEVVAERIAIALRIPLVTAPGRTTTISASIGIAVPQGGEGVDELLRNADVAMYAAKKRARGRWILFNEQMHTDLVDRVTLEADLRRAVQRQEVRLAYQPIVDLGTGRIIGVEALARWSHAERGSVPPATFIPVAEESGLILTLGRWALREACRQAAVWNAERPRAPITMTVNLSGKQLEHESLAMDVAAALRDTGLPAQCLVLEITETVIMHKTEATLARLHELKALGVRLAIDDFGTGYSSLSYLQQFPVDVLKIDCAFTEGLRRGSNDAALVRTIIALAEMLGLRTIAEGVEDARQQEQLRTLGCDAAQGFLFSRPMPAREVEVLLVNQGDEAAAPSLAGAS